MSDTLSNHDETPLVQHLVELRDRLKNSVFFTFILFSGLFYFSDDTFKYAADPLSRILPENSTMIATEVASPFLAPFKLTLFLTLFLSVPFFLFQVWSFIAPALYRREKRLAFPLLISSILLFYSGMAFAYFVVFPTIFGFFTSIGPAEVTVMTDISRYLDFVLKLLLAFGLAFEIPVITIISIVAGAVSADSLASKRPYIIVFCFVFGMLLTPPDVISQSLIAIPMWLLFEIGVLVGRILTNDSERS